MIKTSKERSKEINGETIPLKKNIKKLTLPNVSLADVVKQPKDIKLGSVNKAVNITNTPTNLGSLYNTVPTTETIDLGQIDINIPIKNTVELGEIDMTINEQSTSELGSIDTSVKNNTKVELDTVYEKTQTKKPATLGSVYPKVTSFNILPDINVND
jgi:hypothetical protein